MRCLRRFAERPSHLLELVLPGVAQPRHRTLVLPETATGRSPKQALQLLEFDKQAALEVLGQRQTVIAFWCDACGGLRQRVHQIIILLI